MFSTFNGSSGSILKPFPKSPVFNLGRRNSIDSLTHCAKFGDEREQIFKLGAKKNQNF